MVVNSKVGKKNDCSYIDLSLFHGHLFRGEMTVEPQLLTYLCSATFSGGAINESLQFIADGGIW